MDALHLQSAILQGLGVAWLASLAVEAALRRCPTPASRSIAVGLVFVCAIIVTMLAPTPLVPGMHFDLRNAFLVIAASFGGLPAAAMTLAAAIGTRIYLGGSGMEAGLVGIAISALAGYGISRIPSTRLTPAARGILIGLAPILSFAGLLLLPWSAAVAVATTLLPTLALANFVAVSVLWMMINRTSRQVRTETDLVAEARTDPLTGLRNRSAFRDDIRASLQRANGRPSALLLLDVDNFKAINDTFGHSSGDVVLASIADTLRSSVRHSDFLMRYGGEEFLIVLPATELDQAATIAEIIREQVAAQLVSVQRFNIRVTVSIGVATLAKSDDDALSVAFAAADAALYSAKEHGRNRVELALAA